MVEHGAYASLRRAVSDAGLLDRDYADYAWRGGVSLAILLVGLTLAAVAPPSAAMLLVAAAIIAFGSVQVALIGHDAGHLAVFGNRRLNHALGSACWSLLLGISFWYWSDRHNRHHGATNDAAADPDLQWASVIAYSEVLLAGTPRRWTWLTRHQAIIGPAYALLLPFAFRLEGWHFALRELSGPRRVVDLALLMLSTLAWLLPAAQFGVWWLAVFVTSQILAGLYLSLAIAPNHVGMRIWPAGTPLTFLERQVLSSRNVAPGPIWDFVFGGLNYQIEHHLFPTMPRRHLAGARSLVKPFCRAHGLPYTELGAFASYRLVLAELQRVGRAARA
ncbi:MAG TPA: acyl-CoA desaturase [Chloroflexota bacterium]